MSGGVHGRTIIITGASAGIGRATAVTLAQAGANVVLTARRADRLAELAAELAAAPGHCLVVPGDISQEGFAAHLVAQTMAAFGRVDVLVNNAGLGHRSPLLDLAPTDARTILDVNLLGVLYAVQAVVPPMQQMGGGQIINVSSIVGQRPLPLSGVYCASKTALNFFSRTLRFELRPSHITVTLVYPGLTATEFAQSRFGDKQNNRWGHTGLPATRVAHAIQRAIEKQQTEVYITWYDWLFTHLNRLFPRLTDWLLSHLTQLA